MKPCKKKKQKRGERERGPSRCKILKKNVICKSLTKYTKYYLLKYEKKRSYNKNFALYFLFFSHL